MTKHHRTKMSIDSESLASLTKAITESVTKSVTQSVTECISQSVGYTVDNKMDKIQDNLTQFNHTQIGNLENWHGRDTCLLKEEPRGF